VGRNKPKTDKVFENSGQEHDAVIEEIYGTRDAPLVRDDRWDDEKKEEKNP